MAAAAQVLTFADSNSDSVDNQTDGDDVRKKYIRYERR